MTVTIYHNPDCGTSRNTLAMIRNAGIEPTVIEYLKTPPTRDKLVQLIGAAGLSVREALRQKGTPHAELGLDNPSLGDGELLDAMLKEPDSHQSSVRGDATGRALVPTVRGSSRYPAGSRERAVHKGRRRSGGRCRGTSRPIADAFWR